ncbi:MAG: (2Fe-2S)-binding protein, partial [Solirubrobacterales bacterium]
MEIDLIINGKNTICNIYPEEFLGETLRKYGFLSIRKGCDTSCCGLCTVWVEGTPVLSCSLLTIKAAGKNITTMEGVQDEAEKFAEILVADGAEQCGFCSPGFIMTVLALKNELINPTEEDVIHYLSGNLCRCTGYMGQ